LPQRGGGRRPVLDHGGPGHRAPRLGRPAERDAAGMVRAGTSQRLLIVAATACVVAACADGPAPAPAASHTDSATVLFVPRADGDLARRMLAVAVEAGAAQQLRVRALPPAAATVSEQAKALGRALAAQPRAVLLDPI